jgi:phage terminase small subunit
MVAATKHRASPKPAATYEHDHVTCVRRLNTIKSRVGINAGARGRNIAESNEDAVRAYGLGPAAGRAVGTGGDILRPAPVGVVSCICTPEELIRAGSRLGFDPIARATLGVATLVKRTSRDEPAPAALAIGGAE